MLSKNKRNSLIGAVTREFSKHSDRCYGYVKIVIGKKFNNLKFSCVPENGSKIMIDDVYFEETVTEDGQEIYSNALLAEDSSENDADVTIPSEDENNNNESENNDRIEPDICRICHEVQEDLWLLFGEEMEWNSEPLESLCLCKGTIGLVHRSCLERWLTETRRLFCELCGFRYETNISPRYTRFRSFLRWTTHARGRGPELLLDLLKLSCLLPTTTGCYGIAFLEIYKSFATIEVSKIFKITKMDPKDYLPVTLNVLKALTFVGATSALLHLTITTLLSAADHLEAWYRWWQSDYVIKVVVTPQEDRADRIIPEESRFHVPFMF